ncbi:hypothetical protein SAMD00019534_089020, partial [Acytostelium subglobosum LB1]|uniref:hypothetical protein n=1 Tax=Acytostelium subglobosum LB1 TaxID=1410327 RepID=UPI000645073A
TRDQSTTLETATVPTTTTGSPTSSTSHSNIRSLYAGGISGVVSRTLTAPLERLKILNQAQPLLNNGTKYNNIGSGLMTIWREEGIRGLFKGNGTNVLKAGPHSAIRFYSYEYFKHIGDQPLSSITRTQQLWAGACAGVTSVTFTYPLEVVKTKMTLQFGETPRYSSIMHCVQSTVQQEGVRGLFRGLSAGILNIAPFSALNFASYEWFKSMGNKLYMNTPPVYLSTVYGALSGAYAMTILYPLDVIKRRIMLQGYNGSTVVYRNFAHCAYKIATDEGVRALYHGIKPAYAKVIPTVSLNFFVYEAALLLFPSAKESGGA